MANNYGYIPIKKPISSRSRFNSYMANVNSVGSVENIEPTLVVSNAPTPIGTINPNDATIAKVDNTFVPKPIVVSSVTKQPIKPNIYKGANVNTGNVVNDLYNANYNSIARKGFDANKTKHLATILTQQQILETGWGKHIPAANNYGGMRTSKGYIKFNSLQSFSDSAVKNLDKRWPNWHNAKDAKDYAKIIHTGNEQYSETDYKTYGNRMQGTKDRIMKQLNSQNVNNRRGLDYGGEVERPQAIWGAVIGAAASLVGSLLSSHSQRDVLRKQQIEQRNQAYNEQQQQIVNTANNALASNENLKYRPDLVYKNGGSISRKAIKNRMTITDGGIAQKIGNDTFLLRGGSHADVNEAGKTGIGINFGGNVIEAEGGEVAQKVNNKLRIFSDQPVLGNGISPADMVLSGANKNKVFNIQESNKRKLGISTPIEEFAYGGDIDNWGWNTNKKPFQIGEVEVYGKYPKKPLMNVDVLSNKRFDGDDNVIDKVSSIIPMNIVNTGSVPNEWGFGSDKNPIDLKGVEVYGKKPIRNIKPIFDWNSMKPIHADNPWINQFVNKPSIAKMPETNNNTISLARPQGYIAANGSNTVVRNLPDVGTITQSLASGNSIKDPRWGMSVTGSDWIGLGADLIGSIGSGLINLGGLKGLKANYVLPNHVDEIPVALDTTYHNEAQRAAVERNRLDARRAISNNTASSNVAVSRMQQSDNDALLQENQLWNEKENKEVDLRNQNKLNEQQVRARNAQSMNEHLARVAQIKNAEQDANNQLDMQRMKARQMTLQGIAGAANNFLNQTRQRYEDEQAMRYALAASDNGTAYRMLDMGVDVDQQTLRGLYRNAISSGVQKPEAWQEIKGETASDRASRRKRYERALTNWKHSDELKNVIDSRLNNRSRRKLGLTPYTR